MLGQPQAEGVDVGACVGRSGVGESVVGGERIVVVVGGVDVGDCMGTAVVEYVEVVGAGSTVAVEGRDVGALCTQHRRV